MIAGKLEHLWDNLNKKRESFNKKERENLSSTGINENFETQIGLHYLEVIGFWTESFTVGYGNAKRNLPPQPQPCFWRLNWKWQQEFNCGISE